MHSAEKACDTTSTIKTNLNIIECCNNIHQGAPHTGKQMSTCASDLGNASHITCLYDIGCKSYSNETDNYCWCTVSKLGHDWLIAVFGDIITTRHNSVQLLRWDFESKYLLLEAELLNTVCEYWKIIWNKTVACVV